MVLIHMTGSQSTKPTDTTQLLVANLYIKGEEYHIDIMIGEHCYSQLDIYNMHFNAPNQPYIPSIG